MQHNGDGTFTEKIFQDPIHYKENGVWKDIDANIKPTDTGEFENNTNRFKVKFAGKGKSPNLTSFDYNGMKITYTLADLPHLGSNYYSQANDVTPVVTDSTITYENIFPSVDLRQIIVGDGIKEDIILREYTGKNSFVFGMRVAGVDAVKEEDGSISFYKKGQTPKEKVFTIPKPFMVDSNIDPNSDEPTRSDNVSYDLVQQGANIYITVTADDAWLKAPERKYPVYIDPTTTLYSAGDAYITSAYPTSNYSYPDNWNSTDGYYQLKSGYYDSTTGTNYSFIKFATPSLAGKLIYSAKLNIYCEHSYYVTTPNDVWLNTVTSSLSPSSVTWDTRPSNTALTSVDTVRDTWTTFTVTDPVADWVNGISTNYGFKIHENGNGQTYWKKFRGSHNTSNNPYLSVTYSEVSAPTAIAYGYAANSKSGYADLKWADVPGATGYKVGIFNGAAYEWIDVGDVLSWSTKGKNIWPTDFDVLSGEYAIHWDGLGTELSDNPSLVYQAANGIGYNLDGRYNNSLNYWFRVKAYNSYDETTMSAQVMPTIRLLRFYPYNKRNILLYLR